MTSVSHFLSDLPRSDTARGFVRQNYLIEHTIGSLIRDAFRIYIRHFGTLFLVYILPVILISGIQHTAHLSGSDVLAFLGLLLTFVVGLFASAATTVVVSDVCIGTVPSVKRSYAKIFGKIVLRLLGTNILTSLLVAVGLALLAIPGLVLFIWLLLVPSIVVLENKSGVAALKRSKQLGDGSHWRNAGLMLLLFILTTVIGLVIGAVLGAVLWVLSALLSLDLSVTMLAVVQSVSTGLSVPLSVIPAVLIYYDRRVRKEGYDAKALAEDLAR